MNTKEKYLCPYCDYDKVEIVLASYHCDNCEKRTSVYDEQRRMLYKKSKSN